MRKRYESKQIPSIKLCFIGKHCLNTLFQLDITIFHQKKLAEKSIRLVNICSACVFLIEHSLDFNQQAFDQCLSDRSVLRAFWNDDEISLAQMCQSVLEFNVELAFNAIEQLVGLFVRMKVQRSL